MDIETLKTKSKEIIAYARGLSLYYQDGNERMEIWINKKYAPYFPDVESHAVEITVHIDNEEYTAFFRKTEKCEYIWLCPYMKKDEKRLRTADMLKRHGIHKNDKLVITKTGKKSYIITRF